MEIYYKINPSFSDRTIPNITPALQVFINNFIMENKLNRIVEHFARRGAIQEQLTVAIHNAVDKICEGNIGVAVMIDATHNCVSCRGVKHHGASMQTAKLTGCFLEEDAARAEFYKNIELAGVCRG